MFSLTRMLEIVKEASHFLIVQELKELYVVECLASLFSPLNVSEVPDHCDNPESTLEALPPPLFCWDSLLRHFAFIIVITHKCKTAQKFSSVFDFLFVLGRDLKKKNKPIVSHVAIYWYNLDFKN